MYCAKKKLTAIFFVLFANISLLVHAVVPHHHHEGIAVAVVDATNSIEHEHHNHLHDSSESPKDDSHYHHSHASYFNHQHHYHSEDCLISETMAVITKGDDDFHLSDGGDDLFLNLFFEENIGYLSLKLLESSKILYPFSASTLQSVDVCAHGLRAPPCC